MRIRIKGEEPFNSYVCGPGLKMKNIYIFIFLLLISSCSSYKSITNMGGPGRYQIIVEGDSRWTKAGDLKKSIDKKAQELCGHSNFWAKYTLWGSSRRVYTASVDYDIPTKEMYGSISCNEPLQNKKPSERNSVTGAPS